MPQAACPTHSIFIYVGGRQAGLQAPAEYNVDPYDVNAAKITFSDVCARWSERKSKEVVNGKYFSIILGN